MLALTGYTAVFDRSADRDQFLAGGTVVAGFVSTIEQWAVWEEGWNKILRRFNVPYFHRKEFDPLKDGSRPKGAFAGDEWNNEAHRRDFVSSLIATVKNWAVATVGSYMSHQIYKEANTLCEVDSRFNPFAECGRHSALQVRNFVRDGLKSELPISYVFEKGDEGAGMLIDLMTECNMPAPVFKRPRLNNKRSELDRDDPPLIQLQSADLLAWEIRRWKIDYANKRRMRHSLKAFTDMKHIIWKEVDYKSMAGLIRSLGISRRLSGTGESYVR